MATTVVITSHKPVRIYLALSCETRTRSVYMAPAYSYVFAVIPVSYPGTGCIGTETRRSLSPQSAAFSLLAAESEDSARTLGVLDIDRCSWSERFSVKITHTYYSTPMATGTHTYHIRWLVLVQQFTAVGMYEVLVYG